MALANHWWQIVWLLVFGIFLSLVPHKKTEVVCGKIEYRWHWFFALAFVLPYVIWAGFRTNGNFDTWQYRWTYQITPTFFENWVSHILATGKDKGFAILTVLMKTIFGTWSEGYFLTIASIQMLLLASVYRKYSCNFWFSIFLFVTSTDYMSWMNNGMRQFLAVVIVFSATEFMIEKKYVPLIIVILLASTIHASALVMLPIVFMAQGYAWNKKSIVLLGGVLLVVLAVDRFTDMLDTLLMDTQYENVVSDWKGSQDNGTSPIRALVYSLPTILSLIGYKRIRRENNPIINLATNMAIASTGFWIVSVFTSGIFVGRIPIYMNLYATGILLPWELKHLFSESSRRLFSAVLCGMYLFFFYYQMHFGWGLI